MSLFTYYAVLALMNAETYIGSMSRIDRKPACDSILSSSSPCASTSTAMSKNICPQLSVMIKTTIPTINEIPLSKFLSLLRRREEKMHKVSYLLFNAQEREKVQQKREVQPDEDPKASSQCP